jgi:MarR family transcriptional regulator, organic hydroperoxide resistance regulator
MSSTQKNNNDEKMKILISLLQSEKDLSRISVMFRSTISDSFNLNVSDAECVDYLMDTGPTTAGKLAEITGLTNGAITNVIDRLEQVGFVTRQSDPKDRRKVIVTVVEEKVAQVVALYRPVVEKIYMLFSSYSAGELDFLLHFYQQMMQIYQEGAEAVMAKARAEEKPRT